MGRQPTHPDRQTPDAQKQHPTSQNRSLEPPAGRTARSAARPSGHPGAWFGTPGGRVLEIHGAL